MKITDLIFTFWEKHAKKIGFISGVALSVLIFSQMPAWLKFILAIIILPMYAVSNYVEGGKSMEKIIHSFDHEN